MIRKNEMKTALRAIKPQLRCIRIQGVELETEDFVELGSSFNLAKTSL
jgi:hypothetical protein